MTNQDNKNQEEYQENLDYPKVSHAEVFANMMAAHSDDIRIDRLTLEITGDLAAAIVLTRIVYWFSPSRKDGRKRTRIIKDGKDWIAKSDDEWWEECGVTPKQIKRVKQLLIKLGVIDIDYKMFNGMRTSHYHLNLDTYYNLYLDITQKITPISPKGTDREFPKGSSGQDQRDRPITRDYKQEINTKDLYMDKGSGVSARILSLVNLCFEKCFCSDHDALQWLINLGLRSDKASDIVKNHKLIEIRAGAEYLKRYIDTAKNMENMNVAGYFVKIMENHWYLNNRNPKKQSRTRSNVRINAI